MSRARAAPSARRTANSLPRAEVRVLEQTLDGGPPPGLATDLPPEGGVPECYAGSAAGFVGRGVDSGFHLHHLYVEAHFFIEIAVELAAFPGEQQPTPEFTKPGHHAPP
jgi:hypothetical protein